MDPQNDICPHGSTELEKSSRKASPTKYSFYHCYHSIWKTILIQNLEHISVIIMYLL